MKDYFNIINKDFLDKISIKNDESSINIASIRYNNDKKLIDEIINKKDYKYLNKKEINIIKNFNKSIREYNDELNLNFLKNEINNLLKLSNEDLILFCFKNKINGLFNIDIITYNKIQSVYIIQGRNIISNINLYKDADFLVKYKKNIYDILSIFIKIDENNIDKILEHELNLYNLRLTNVQRRDVLNGFHEFNFANNNNFVNINLKNILLSIFNEDIQKLYFDVNFPNEYYKYIDQNINDINFKYYILWCILHGLSLLSFGTLYDKIFDLIKIIKGIKNKINTEKHIYNINNYFIGHIISKEFFINIDSTIKQRIKEYINNIKDAFKNRLTENNWMDNTTKKLALEKLENIKTDIFESKLIDFNKIRELSNIYYDNILMINDYVFKIKMQKLKINEKIFHGNIYNINAFYDSTINYIIFPYGILKEPYYYNTDLNNTNNLNIIAYNYGAIGSVIGHEIIHGFDDQGRLFDKDGNLNNWWNKISEVKYLELAEEIGNKYKEYDINSKLTMGENIADIGGVRISLSAFKLYLKKNNKELNEELLKYFISGWAMIWRGKIRKEDALNRLLNDSHSPIKQRVNIPLNNLKELNDKNYIEIW
uniref:Peptidase M13 C-terminal domain-containing protein n=1 Tax=viral metagenome TaxID=1070528 RepID=A0A6C0GZX9_9ZZZZ